ncbi:hypothetical protein BDZ97DRAFT_975740 [Flammula alnicola]|nr:hypothetical protein BDZ97DRAFT_975740 [Flammula alnicola]
MYHMARPSTLYSIFIALLRFRTWRKTRGVPERDIVGSRSQLQRKALESEKGELEYCRLCCLSRRRAQSHPAIIDGRMSPPNRQKVFFVCKPWPSYARTERQRREVKRTPKKAIVGSHSSQAGECSRRKALQSEKEKEISDARGYWSWNMSYTAGCAACLGMDECRAHCPPPT